MNSPTGGVARPPLDGQPLVERRALPFVDCDEGEQRALQRRALRPREALRQLDEVLRTLPQLRPPLLPHGPACEARVPLLVFGSSLHVYGGGLTGTVGPETPYGPQTDLAHLSKIYGEQALTIEAASHGFGLAVMRLGIVYGPSPVEHDAAESQTVVEKFRRLAAAGDELPLDDGGRATIGVVHVEDVARILLEAKPGAENVAAETVTVAEIAALARGEEARDRPAFTFASPFSYRHRVADYLGE